MTSFLIFPLGVEISFLHTNGCNNAPVVRKIFTKKYLKVKSEMGSNQFYMPHGITVDADNNIWVTDAALHQVDRHIDR